MEMVNYIIEYNNKIQSGELAACKKIRSVYQHLVDSIEHPTEFKFDIERANHPIEFMERFCHLSKGDGAGKLVKLELWQKALLQAIFGFVDSNGIRRFRECFLTIGRKNGKSTLSSMIGLYMLLVEKDSPEIYALGRKRDQSKIIFNEAVRMIKKSSEIRAYCRIRVADIITDFNSGVFAPLSSESNSLDGLNTTCGLLDECHAWTDSNLYHVIADSQSGRKNPLLFITTTAGFVRENIWDDLYKRSERTINGYSDNEYNDDRFLPIIYELDDQNEWKESKNWLKANPSLGVCKDFRQLAEKVERAKADVGDLNNLLTKDFDYPASGARSYLMWETIRNNETFDLKSLISEETYIIGGFDLSKNIDLTSTCAMLKIASNPEKIYILSMSWITEDALDKNKESKIPYRKWIEKRFLRVCPGNLIDYNVVTQWFAELQENGLYMFKCFYDPYSANQLILDMEQSYGKNTCEKIIQGAKSLSLPLEYLKGQLEAKNLIYGNNPVLQWGLANLQVTLDANGNMRPTKNRNLAERNDPAMALLDCLAGYLRYTGDYDTMISDKN